MGWYSDKEAKFYDEFQKEREKAIVWNIMKIDKKMRRPERIPIVLANIDWEKFLTIADKKPSDDTLDGIFNALDTLAEKWGKSPDVRLGQLLVNMGLAPDELFNLEEDQWMVDTGQIDAKDIMFWGVNYTKDMVQLPKTEFRLIRDLDTDHIEAILDGGFVRKGGTYEGYFENELERRNELNEHDD